jgi:hypothetical protein
MGCLMRGVLAWMVLSVEKKTDSRGEPGGN